MLTICILAADIRFFILEEGEEVTEVKYKKRVNHVTVERTKITSREKWRESVRVLEKDSEPKVGECPLVPNEPTFACSTKADVLQGLDKDAKVAVEKCIEVIEKDKKVFGYWGFKPKEVAKPKESADKA